MQFRNKGFTLIELLVVISIIGLLSSVVLVYLSGFREKARLARMLQFSSSLHHALGAELVGEWRFEEGAINTCQGGNPLYNDVCDSSGNSNHGEWQGTGTHWVDNEISQLGMAGQFDVGGNYVEIPDSDILDGMNSLTIQVWFKSELDCGSFCSLQKIIYKNPSYFLGYDYNLGYQRVAFNVRVTATCGFNYSVPPAVFLSIGRWYHLVWMYNGGTATQNPKFKVYLDGEKIYDAIVAIECIQGGPDPIYNSNTPLDIGKEHVGLIDDVRIYKDELTSVQIKKLYVEGAEERGLLVME